MQVFGNLPELDCPDRGQLSCISNGFALPNPLTALNANSTRLMFTDSQGQRRNLLQLLSINSVISWWVLPLPRAGTSCLPLHQPAALALLAPAPPPPGPCRITNKVPWDITKCVWPIFRGQQVCAACYAKPMHLQGEACAEAGLRAPMYV